MLKKKSLVSIIALVIFSALLVNHMNLIETIHNSLIFLPSKEFYSSPAQDGIAFEEVPINTPDGETLFGYLLPAKEKTQKTIIYLHGNADNVSTWYQAPLEIQKHVSVNALIVDYRGYGKSTGKPTIEGVITDAQTMYKFLIDRGYKSEDISVYGRSIGGAIALELASKEKVKSIVVQSSFTSLRDLAKEIYPLLPQFIVRDDIWNSKNLIKKIHCPILISHGDEDEIVQVSHAHKLYELANEPKKLIILKGATHNDISSYLNEEYFRALEDLFL